MDFKQASDSIDYRYLILSLIIINNNNIIIRYSSVNYWSIVRQLPVPWALTVRHSTGACVLLARYCVFSFLNSWVMLSDSTMLLRNKRRKNRPSIFESLGRFNSSNMMHGFAIATVSSNVVLWQYRCLRSRSSDFTKPSHEIRRNITLTK